MQWYEKPEEIQSDEKTVRGFFYDYRWLSNFHETWIKYDGLLFRSTENAYQAMKTLDRRTRETLQDFSPGMAKKVARHGIVLRDDWEDIKIQVMFEVNWEKYTSHTELRKKLLATGDKHLEETNWWGDTFWGVYKGQGENQLGKVLMDIREKLKNL